MLQVCKVCQKAAEVKCGGCRLVFYCSKQHQRDDWKGHRGNCKPFKLEEDEMGRHLVAVRNLNPGDVVWQEAPLIWGPAPKSVPVCLGCGKGIDSTNSRPCSKCGWPVCEELCERAPGHLPECRYTAQRGNKVTITDFDVPHPIYNCITVLRCLYQKQFLSKSWKKLETLKSNCNNRKKNENERTAMAEFMRRFFKIEFSDQEILQVYGIVSLNSHKVPLTSPPHIAIYATASNFEHSCSSNCTKSFTDHGHILVTAAAKIAIGERLTLCYANPLWGTSDRRMFLNETKHFSCHCPRCEDPTEFGTSFSAIKCRDSNCAGFLLPKSFTYESNKPPDWICSKCQKASSSFYVHDILERIGNDLTELNKSNENQCRNFLESYRDYLHENHFYVTSIKYALIRILGQNQSQTEENENEKMKLCKELIKLIGTVAPAEKRALGVLLFELGNSRVRAAIKSNVQESVLLDSRRILEEAVEILKHEPEVLPEGKVCKRAVEILMDLNSTVYKNQGCVEG